jgi:cytoskeletal protein RodZ
MALTEQRARALGELLKQRRSEMNLSLQEAESATSIRINYLSAIEDGQALKLLAPVYVEGFMRQYARFLGLDGDKMSFDQKTAPAAPGEIPQLPNGIGTLEVRVGAGGGVKWVPNLLWIGISLAVVAGAWLFARALGVL